MRLTFLLLLLSFASLAQVSDATLTTQSNVIGNETVPSANTKTRIAAMYQAIIDSKVSILLPRLSTSSTIGYVWTATDTNGNGSWQAVSGGSGTVTSVSVATANGFSGSVANSTTTPAITLTLQDASGSQSGKLTSTDWATFNNKLSTGTITDALTAIDGDGTNTLNIGANTAFNQISIEANSIQLTSGSLTLTDTGGEGVAVQDYLSLNPVSSAPAGSINGSFWFNSTAGSYQGKIGGSVVSFSTSGDMVLAAAQTNTGAKTFNDGTLLLRNVANTFNGSFTNTNTADRVYTLPNQSGEVALAPTRKSALVIEADFYTDTSPYSPSFVGTAISGGTDNVISGQIDHPGIIDLRDGTTANGGWVIQTATNAFRLAGSEKCVVTFQIRNARATATGWIGFKDNTTNAQPVDGAYVYFVGNGTTVTMDARTRSNSTETINGTTWTPTLNTWYTLVIELNSNATQVNYEVFEDSGVSQWAVNNTTNIPTASGREVGFGIQVNESTTDAAAAIMYVDYARMEIRRILVR